MLLNNTYSKIVKENELQNKKRAGNGIPHPLLPQTKSAIQGESLRHSYPPKNISIVMTHSLFPIPVNSPPPLPAPTPSSTSSTTPAVITSGW